MAPLVHPLLFRGWGGVGGWAESQVPAIHPWLVLQLPLLGSLSSFAANPLQWESRCLLPQPAETALTLSRASVPQFIPTVVHGFRCLALAWLLSRSPLLWAYLSPLRRPLLNLGSFVRSWPLSVPRTLLQPLSRHHRLLATRLQPGFGFPEAIFSSGSFLRPTASFSYTFEINSFPCT